MSKPTIAERLRIYGTKVWCPKCNKVIAVGSECCK